MDQMSSSTPETTTPANQPDERKKQRQAQSGAKGKHATRMRADGYAHLEIGSNRPPIESGASRDLEAGSQRGRHK